MDALLDTVFEPAEKLYRAVHPKSMYWKDDGSVSSAAFFSKKGHCSVDRGNYRDDAEVIQDMRNRNFKGKFVSVTVQICYDIDANVVYAPSKGNIYHSEIHGDKEQRKLTPKQRRHLAKHATVLNT